MRLLITISNEITISILCGAFPPIQMVAEFKTVGWKTFVLPREGQVVFCRLFSRENLFCAYDACKGYGFSDDLASAGFFHLNGTWEEVENKIYGLLDL